jgi:hypothetical protein
MKLQLLLTLGIASSALCLSACSSSTEPASSDIWKSPDVGSVYVFNGTTTTTTVTDSTRTSIDQGSASFVVDRTGQTMGGKSNVTRFEGSQGPNIAYESNGDFSIGDSNSNGWEWTTYPAGSHTTISSPNVDSLDMYGTRHVSKQISFVCGAGDDYPCGSVVHRLQSYRGFL